MAQMPGIGTWVEGSVSITPHLTARDVSYARRWFVHQHYYRTTPPAFVSESRTDGLFDDLCEDNALSVQALKEWAARMYELDNPGEQYES